MKKKILAVDDSTVMLRIISGAIEAIGFEPVTAMDGREALKVLDDNIHDIALILLDWNMPKLDGLETLKIIKEDDIYRRIPVMMVTTESDPGYVIEAVRAGAINYLNKPFSLQDLSVRIMESLGMGLSKKGA